MITFESSFHRKKTKFSLIEQISLNHQNSMCWKVATARNIIINVYRRQGCQTRNGHEDSCRDICVALWSCRYAFRSVITVNSLNVAAVESYVTDKQVTDSCAALPSNSKMPLMAKNKSVWSGSELRGRKEASWWISLYRRPGLNYSVWAANGIFEIKFILN